MERIGFIGTYDKTDFIIYVARVLVELGKKVLVIDSTVNQKAKYVVPAINPTVSYVTEYEGIDVAVGFKDYNGIKQYLGMPESAVFTYDYILLDMDNPNLLESFDIYAFQSCYFVTSPDLFCLKKGLEIISGIRLPLNLTKIYFSNNMSKEEDDYLNFYFPMQSSDMDIIVQNQRLSKIKFKGISSEYKDALVGLVQEIAKGESPSNVKRAFRQLEKGV